jgi:bifunctional DNA-binding transcriptional regulator/antitoxin component of YhaV-PrlF toxin-antitoxin module
MLSGGKMTGIRDALDIKPFTTDEITTMVNKEKYNVTRTTQVDYMRLRFLATIKQKDNQIHDKKAEITTLRENVKILGETINELCSRGS